MTHEKTTAAVHAINRCQALKKEDFREGWIQRMVNMPAEIKLERPTHCANRIETGVPTEVFRVRYPIFTLYKPPDRYLCT